MSITKLQCLYFFSDRTHAGFQASSLVSGWLDGLWCGVCVRHGEEEDLLLTFTLNPAEPSTAGMPQTGIMQVVQMVAIPLSALIASFPVR